MIFECQAFASVRTSVAMVVGMEVRVVAHNTVRQSAQRLGLFFSGHVLPNERPIGAVPAHLPPTNPPPADDADFADAFDTERIDLVILFFDEDHID